MRSFRNAKKNSGSLVEEETELSSKYAGPFFVPESKSANQIAIENLRDQLKSIQWHKLANEASLQASLIRRKQARLSATMQAKERMEQETQVRRTKSLDQATRDGRRPLTTNSHPARKEEPRTSSREKACVFEGTEFGNDGNEIQSKKDEKGRDMTWKDEKQRGDKQNILNRTRYHVRPHSVSEVDVSCLKYSASTNEFDNDFQMVLAREDPEEARCVKEAPLPTVLTTVSKVITLEARIRQLSENQTDLAKEWLFGSETSKLNQPFPPKTADALDKGSSSHLSVSHLMSRESSSNDEGIMEDGLKQNRLLRSKDGRRVVITTPTKSSGHRAASYDHLKIPNNVPSQKRMKVIDKCEQKRRSSC